MKQHLIVAGLVAMMAMPLAAQAQGIIGGAENGAAQGRRAAGPVGAAVGGAVGAAVGGIVGGVRGVLGRPHRGYYYYRGHRYYGAYPHRHRHYR